MPTNFPASLDDFVNPLGTDDVSVVLHSAQHTNKNDAIEAIEAKVGIDASAISTTIDYLLKNPASANPGHTHTAALITDFTEVAQDAIGAMVDTTLVYVDATPLLTRAALTGDITAPQASNVTTLANTAVTPGAYGNASNVSQITVDSKGRITSAANVSISQPTNTLQQTMSAGATTDIQLVSTVVTGTSPFTIASTTKVTNLNADLLDDKTTGTSGNVIPLLDGANTWSATQAFAATTATQTDTDNLRLDANTLSSTDLNGNINIVPSGTGVTRIGSASNYVQVASTGILTLAGTAEYRIASNTKAFASAAASSAGLAFSTSPNRFNFTDTSGVDVFFVPLISGAHSIFGYSAPSTSPAQIVADQNNYVGGGQTAIWRLDSDAARTITGITAPLASRGKFLRIYYVGSFSIILSNNNAASLAANRLFNTSGADITLTVNQGALLWYDDISLVWRVTKLA